jgi:GNAT superfamily N-acetyltransferase
MVGVRHRAPAAAILPRPPGAVSDPVSRGNRMYHGVQISPSPRFLPSDFDELVEESVREGYGFLERMRSDWACGAVRFSGQGECLFRAHVGPHTLGLCGRTRDPYAPGDRVGRIRHLYVTPAARNRGVGSALLTAVINGAALYFSELRLRSSSTAASRLYLKHGFDLMRGDAYATHRLDLSPEAVKLSAGSAGAGARVAMPEPLAATPYCPPSG